jgi:hypothetical protein
MGVAAGFGVFFWGENPSHLGLDPGEKAGVCPKEGIADDDNTKSDPQNSTDLPVANPEIPLLLGFSPRLFLVPTFRREKDAVIITGK